MNKLWSKNSLLTLLLAVISFASVTGQNLHSVTGTVKNKNGEAIQGASVNVVGASRATMTNEQGIFRIEAKNGEILEVTNVGYKKSSVVISSSAINIVLEESSDNTLGEVVVVGYGQNVRRNLTSSQISIKPAEIEKTVNTTFDQALQGRAAGVMVTSNTGQPGGSVNVSIRGLSTIFGTTQPLYVIDGIQTQPQEPGFGVSSSSNALSGLNPNDIESMEILQGPSAAAIYGSRATNGVVLITTKKGKSGEAKISYDFTYSLQDQPKPLAMLTLRDYTIMNNQLRRFGNEQIPEWQKDSSILGEGTNWQREIFKRAPLMKHQVSLSGGSENTRYYLSLENFKQDGIIDGSGFKRNGVRLNVDNNARKWLKLSARLSANQTDEKLNSTQSSIVRMATTMAPYVPAYNPDGTYGDYPQNEAAYTAENINPLAIASLRKINNQKREVVGGLTAVASLLKGLNFTTNINGSFNNGKLTDFSPTYKIGSKSNANATLNQNMSQSFYWNWNQLLEYNTKIANNHNIKVMLGHEAQEVSYDGLMGFRGGFTVNELPGGQLPAINLGDVTTQTNLGYKGWNSMESYFGRLNYNFKNKYLLELAYRKDGSVNFGALNRWGSFPSGSVAWRVIEEGFMKKQHLISDLKLRFETGLTGNQGDQAGIYGELYPVPTPWGNGFLMKRYPNPNLKWEETMTYNFGFNLGLLSNKITLEGDFYTRTTDNLLMENLLPFYMGTNDAEGNIAPPIVNIGSMQNKGWAFTLNTKNIDKPNFKWSTNFNISHNANKILRFNQETAVLDRSAWRTSGFVQRSVVGQPAWQFYGYVLEGIFKTVDELNSSALPEQGSSGQKIAVDAKNGIWIGDYKYKDLNGDGLINTKDQTFIGNPYPKFTFGFTNNITWKAFDLSVLLTGSYGNDIYNAFRFSLVDPGRIYRYQNVLKETMDNYAQLGYDNTGQPTVLLNPNATIARWRGNANANFERASSGFVEDGSYIKVKNITLSYQVPANVIKYTRIIRGLKFGFGVQNAFVFTKYKGYDPEIGSDVGYGSAAARRVYGVDVAQYPQVRMYNFNLGVNWSQNVSLSYAL